MHERISINTLSLAPGTFRAHVETVSRIGASAISPGVEEIAVYGTRAARRLLADTGHAVATLTHRAFAFATTKEADAARERLFETIEMASDIQAETITLTSGGRGALCWQDAADRFATAMRPCAERAAAAGVVVSLEPTSHLYADVSIAHRLTDVIALADAAGIGVGIDLFACWGDADIDAAIVAAGPRIALVQVSDYVAGDRGLPCRAVPGDGMIPLDRAIADILSTGYEGHFDLEIIGPRLIDEGMEQGLRRAGDWLTGALRGEDSGRRPHRDGTIRRSDQTARSSPGDT